MASVVKASLDSSHGTGTGTGTGTEFVSIQPPAKDALDGYDNTLPCAKQTIHIPPVFHDAMAVREQVYAEQGVPLEAEFDQDDARSWHWVAYASVAVNSASLPNLVCPDSCDIPADDACRAACASRVPVATIRLIPPPHPSNQYLEKPDGALPSRAEEAENKSIVEPYVKLGRLAVLSPYRRLGLSKLLVNTVFDFATQNWEKIYGSPSPTAIETAQAQGLSKEKQMTWNGLLMIHAQVHLQPMWEKHGFRQELSNENGEIEAAATPRWMEEGIEHVGMWKRLPLVKAKTLSLAQAS